MRINNLFEGARSSFRLNEGLVASDYEITKSLRGVKRWKARTYVGNNGMDSLGEMHEVGYIMISLVDDTIIPISRDDEHHRGMDLLYDMQSGDVPGVDASKINARQYFPFWPYQNYVYDDKDLEQLSIVARKALAYGNPDTPVNGAGSMRGKVALLSDLAEHGAFIQNAGELAPVGKRIYSVFEELSQTIQQVGYDADRIQARPVFAVATRLIEALPMMLAIKLGLKADQVRELPNAIKAFQKNNDVQGLEKYVFGFDGIKNIMHIYMKTDANSVWKEDLHGIWGDLDLAIDLLSRL